MAEMNITKIKISLLAFVFVLLLTVPGFSQNGPRLNVPNTDGYGHVLIGFFDLRDRETFIQVTNVDGDPSGANIHI